MLRISPNIMVHELRDEFRLNADSFSSLGSLFLFAYSLAQIPLGKLTDIMSVRAVTLYSITLCVIGGWLFSWTDNFVILQLSRVLIGLGSASAFMCAVKIAADNFPQEKRGILIGATLAIGSVGALISGNLLLLLVEHYNWRIASAISAYLGIFVFFVVYSRVQKSTKITLNTHSMKESFNAIVKILRNREIMLYAILAIGLYTPLSTLADLWGAAFLKQKFGITHQEASNLSLYLYVGLGFGSVLLPWMAERKGKLRQSIIICSYVVAFLFIIVIYSTTLTKSQLTILMLSIGFFCGAEMMCFTVALEKARGNSGEIIGVVNTLNMLGNAILQQFVGLLLDYGWSGEYTETNLRQYSTSNFTFAMSALVGMVILCTAAPLLWKKKNSRDT